MMPLRPHPISRTPKAGLVALAVILGLLSLRQQQAFLEPPRVYVRDIKLEWLMARAILDGEDPYQPQSDLVARYLPGQLVEGGYVHPAPGGHPPFMALLAMPLGLLPYPAAAAAWFGLELLCLGVLIRLAPALAGRRVSLRAGLVIFGLALAWPPVGFELVCGQLSLLLAVLLTGAGVAWLAGRPRLCGLLIGLAAAIKLLPLALLAFFVLRRRWQVVAAALAALAATSLLALALLGPTPWQSYLLAGLPNASILRGAVPSEWSLWGAVQRLAPGSPAAPLAVLALAGGVYLLAWRARDERAGYALALCGMVLASPVAWQHYWVMLAGALWLAAARLQAEGWPVSPTNRWLAGLILISIPCGVLTGPLPAVAPLLLFAPTLGTLCCVLVLARGRGALSWPGATADAAARRRHAVANR